MTEILLAFSHSHDIAETFLLIFADLALSGAEWRKRKQGRIEVPKAFGVGDRGNGRKWKHAAREEALVKF